MHSMLVASNHSWTRAEVNERLIKLGGDHQEILLSAYRQRYLNIFPRLSLFYWIEKYTHSLSDLAESGRVKAIHPWTTCGKVADALLEQNIFQQNYLNHIGSFDELKEKLRVPDECGLFMVGIDEFVFTLEEGDEREDAPFIFDQADMTKYFPGHAFSIIKIIEENKPVYRIAQSYVDKYGLDKYVKDFPNYYTSFEELEENILQPLSLILSHHGIWEKRQAEAYKKITGISGRKWIGYSNKNAANPNFEIKYTSNTKSWSKLSLYHAIADVSNVAGPIFLAAGICFLTKQFCTFIKNSS